MSQEQRGGGPALPAAAAVDPAAAGDNPAAAGLVASALAAPSEPASQDHLMAEALIHPSAASLSHLDLPLSPVVATLPCIGGSRTSSPKADQQDSGHLHAAEQEPGMEEALAAPAAEAEAGPAGTSPLRAASLRLSVVDKLRQPGTEVWAFGRGDCGQLGVGQLEDAFEPQLVEGLRGRDVVNLAASTVHTAAVTADGELYVCGSNDAAQLGIKHRESAELPSRVTALEAFTVQAVACGQAHTVALVDGGAVVNVGSNEFGQLGLGATSTQVDLPRVVKDLRSMHIVRVAAGGTHTLALSSTGGVFSFGNGSFGALGRGTTEGTGVPRPISRLWPLGIVQVACGDSHSAALTADGRLLTWGRGKYGALGHGDLDNRSTPQVVARLAGVTGRQVSCGDDHTVLLADDGAVWSWGRGIWGQTGQGSTDDRCSPKQVAALAGRQVVQVSAGGRHTLALTSDNQLWGFGCNDSGQLGGPAATSQAMPRLVEGLPACPILFVVAGGDHSMVVVDRGGCVEAGAIGPCAYRRPHGEQWCAVVLPNLLELTQQAAAHKGNRARLEAVIAAVEKLFASPGYILEAFSSRHQVQQQQQQAEEQQGDAREQVQLRQQAGQQGEEQQQGGKRHKGGERQKQQHQQQQQQSHQHGAEQHQHQEQQQQHGAEQQAAQKDEAQPMEMDQGPAAGQQEAQQQRQQQQQQTQAERLPLPPQQQQAEEQQSEGNGTRRRKQQEQEQQEQRGNTAGALDVPRIAATYQALLRLYDPAVVNALGNTCVRLLDMLEKFLNSLAQQQRDAAAGDDGLAAQHGAARRQDLAWLAPVLFVLLQSPLNNETGSFGGKLLMRICRILGVTVPGQERMAVRQALQPLLALLPAEALAARCVRPVQRYLDTCVAAGLGATRLQVLMAGVLLDIMRRANEDAGGIIPYTEFHSAALSEHANLQAEYLQWVRNKDPNALVSICQMPYLLTPEAKSRIMHGEAALQQQQHLSAAAMQALFQGVSAASVAYLEIHVRRTSVVEDALNQLVHRSDDLKKPLRVTFISGGVPEPAQDEGGVTKEFFQLLTGDLFKPEFGMFTYDEHTRTHWFNAASLESEVEFALVGALLGLAIYNGVILSLHFPMVVYKKLLGVKPTFEDLKAAFPDLGRGLQQLLDFEGDVEGVFCRSFTAEYDFYGELKTVELKPGGQHIPVTAANRHEFVRLYTQWLLEGSIEMQFTNFKRGFLMVCNGPALTLFTPAELELLICGLPHLDFEALQRVAKYEAGYSREHQEVRWFWEVVHSLPLEQKRALLQFTTGSDRAPVGGLAKMPLLIQRAGPDTDRLPTSHTCFNALLLPEYNSKEKLRAKLLTAVENARGFGLQ